MQNNFKKFKKGPLIFSIVLLLLSIFVFLFIFQTTQGNNKKFDELEAQWQKENSKKEEIKSIDRSLKMVEAERTSLDTHFIRSSDVVPLLDTIEKLAPEAGAVAQVDSVDAPADNTGITVGLKATGRFEAIYKFITLLENAPYQLEFISVDIRKSDTPTVAGKDQTGPWSAALKVKLLSFIQ